MKRNFLKSTTIAVFLLIFCVLFNSCQKDEVNNPERKIKKIYTGSMDGPKYLQQEWTWDENKLQKNDYYYDGDYISNTEYYTYEYEQL